MTVQEKTESFAILGKFLAQFRTFSFAENDEVSQLNTHFANRFNDLVLTSENHNAWFTPENVRLAFGNLANALKKENIESWISRYPALKNSPASMLNIGVIMAGNIPLVGFHDFMSVIFSGNRLIAKLSDRDNRLLPAIMDVLTQVNGEYQHLVKFEEDHLRNPDAVIATGSNNSSRYFEYYFGKYPHIIRKNRNSAAVLDGSESKSDLENLASDVFTYFGLGCRNVSKIFIPDNYDITRLLDHFQHYAYLGNHHKYANNYDYHRAVLLVNKIPFFDTGFLVVKEDSSYSSPVGTLHYERYTSKEELRERMNADRDQLQCIVAENMDSAIDFGESQSPMLWDYADNVDTMKFLINLSSKTGHGF